AVLWQSFCQRACVGDTGGIEVSGLEAPFNWRTWNNIRGREEGLVPALMGFLDSPGGGTSPPSRPLMLPRRPTDASPTWLSRRRCDLCGKLRPQARIEREAFSQIVIRLGLPAELQQGYPANHPARAVSRIDRYRLC